MTLLLTTACLKLTPFRPPSVAVDGTVELPLVGHPDDRVRPYVQVENAWGTTLWFVDTGYAATTCDTAFVEAQGWTARRSLQWTRGAGGTVGLRKTRIPPFALGSSQIDGMTCATRPLAETSSIPEGVDGVLGSNLLRSWVVELDWDDEVMRLHPPGTPLPSARFELRRELVSPRVKAPLQLGEHTRWILVDTGASATWMDADGAGLTLDHTAVRTVTGTGGSRELEIAYYQPGDVSLGGHPATLTALRQKSRRQVLGMDVFGSYAALWLDYQALNGAVEPR